MTALGSACFFTIFQLNLFFFSVYSFEGLLVFGLLLICSCAYIRKVPRLKTFFLSEKKGFFGVFYKGEFTNILTTPFLMVDFDENGYQCRRTTHQIWT